MLDSTLVILAAYLWGAVPSAYIVGRYARGVDIRSYGSGNVGASNLSELMGPWTGFGLGVFDCLVKGTLPVVAARLLDQGLSVQAGAGLAAMAGHNWSPYIRFTGGRGVATAIGVLVGLAMWKELLAMGLIMGLIGRLLLRDFGFWTLMAALALPLLTLIFSQPLELTYASIAMVLLLVLKRLTANWEGPEGGYGLPRVLAFRVLWDRDVPRKEDWTSRRPSSGRER